MNLTMQMAQQVENTTYEAIPVEVIAKAKLLILDHLGCMIAGSQTPQSTMLTKYVSGTDGGGRSSVIGTSHMFTPANAAHVNAHAASALSLDDSIVRFGHPGNGLLSAAFAVAEDIDATGQELLTSVVAAYETVMRVGYAVRPSPERQKQVWGYASWSVFGATTAAAKLHGMSANDIASAFGMTAWHAPTSFLKKFYDKPLNKLKNNYGWASRGGVTSVELIRAGFHGSQMIFDGDDGYWAMCGSDQFDADMIVLPRADRHFVLEVGFKPYSVCRWIHTTLDCIAELMSEKGLTHDNFDSIEINTAADFIKEFNGPWPTDTMEAILHIPYAVALELHGKSPSIGVHEADLQDKDLRVTAERLRLTVMSDGDEKFFNHDQTPVKIIAKMRDGRILSAEATLPRGHPNGPPFGVEEVHAKFMDLSVPVIGTEASERISEFALDLENKSARDILRLTNQIETVA